MHRALLIALVGLVYILGFGGLSYLRRQGLSLRFAIEGLVATLLAVALTLAHVPVSPLLFLFVIYLVTMRARLLVDLGNWFSGKRQYARALSAYALALRVAPDRVSRKIVLIGRGMTQLRLQEPEAARLTLTEALGEEQGRPGALYLAACLYNLGLACRRTGREAEAVRCFNQAIDVLPSSIYARAAQRALEERRP